MKNNIKTVYITGCLGFIGSYITRTCLNKKWYVKGVDKITYASDKIYWKNLNHTLIFHLYIVI